MDVHVPFAVTTALKLRGIDVLTAQQDGCSEIDDVALLNRATELGRILVTQDDDLLRIGALWQADGASFQQSSTRTNCKLRLVKWLRISS